MLWTSTTLHGSRPSSRSYANERPRHELCACYLYARCIYADFGTSLQPRNSKFYASADQHQLRRLSNYCSSTSRRQRWATTSTMVYARPVASRTSKTLRSTLFLSEHCLRKAAGRPLQLHPTNKLFVWPFSTTCCAHATAACPPEFDNASSTQST